MTDGGYTVVLIDNSTHHYDNVETGNGWVKCFMHRPGRNNKMVAFPSWRVERVETAEVIA